jgi:hypothetical protein
MTILSNNRLNERIDIMIIYVKCHICEQLHPINEVEILQGFTNLDEIKDENILCKECFANRQDNLAYCESNGEFTNYEDWMQSKGATICNDIDCPCREY